MLAINRIMGPALRRLPPAASAAALSRQRVSLPFFGPAAPLAGTDDRLLEVTPLYAGECAREITEVAGAADAVRALSPR